MDNLIMSKINDTNVNNGEESLRSVKGYQTVMARMKKGREDRDAIKAMTSRTG